MLPLAERVYRTVLGHSLLPPGARVIVALSGGADSTALACLLVDLAKTAGFRVLAAAHFNHRLRGAAADADEAFCRELAGRLGLECRTDAADVASLAARARMSVEEASRHYRYAFLRRVALDLGATHVAVGHTRDDQAETVLLRLFRGAGPGGLRAMALSRAFGPEVVAGAAGVSSGEEARIWLVRPLLEIRHEELVRWLEEGGTAFREDESNRDARYLRNRVRHEVIPFLEDRISRSVSRVLARDAAIAASDAECLDALAKAAFDRLAVAAAPGRVEIDRDGLTAEPEAIARRVALLAIRNVRQGRFAGFDQGNRVLAVARGVLPGPVALPGVVVSVRGGRLALSGADPRGKATEKNKGGSSKSNFWSCALSIPGEAVVAQTGLVLSSSLCPWTELDASRLLHSAREAVVDAATVSDGLAVRFRCPGDWLRPLGLGGRKKLQDYLVDRKVPRAERDRLPLVVDVRGRIVWVAGHGIDEEYCVSEGTRDVVILKLRGESA